MLQECGTDYSSKRYQASGWMSLKTAPCVFVYKWLVMLFCVDSLIMFAKKESEIDDVKSGLNNKLKLKDLEKPKRLFKINLKWEQDGSLRMTPTQFI